MTIRETNAAKKMIAVFMGYEYIPFNNPLGFRAGWWHPKSPEILKRFPVKSTVGGDGKSIPFYLGRAVKDMKYNSDWNWLMNACKKWDNLPYDEFKTDLAKRQYTDRCELLDNAVTCYEIEYAFLALTECIEWYNRLMRKG